MLRRFVRLNDMPAGEIAAADVKNLALLNEDFHRLPDFIPRRFARDVVHLIEIDVIGFHSPQAVVAGAANFHGGKPALHGQVIGIAVHISKDFCRENGFFAPSAALREPSADDFFGDPLPLLPAIHVSGIEKVDPQLQRLVHDGMALSLRRMRPEIHGAQTEAGNFQTRSTQRCVLHLKPRGKMSAVICHRPFAYVVVRTAVFDKWQAMSNK